MQEIWKSLSDQGFVEHSVSDLGRVQNDVTGRFMSLTRNQQGFIKVSINSKPDNVRHTIQVNRLVARAFVSGESEIFNNVIHMNGNKDHTFATNLRWRPRWFALKYHAQFNDRAPFVPEPIFDLDSGETFDDSREAAVKYGLIETDIFRSTCNYDVRVFPTRQTFGLVRAQ